MVTRYHAQECQFVDTLFPFPDPWQRGRGPTQVPPGFLYGHTESDPLKQARGKCSRIPKRMSIKVANPLYVVLGEDQFTQSLEVEPSVGGSLDASIVEVEAVDVNVCTNSVSL